MANIHPNIKALKNSFLKIFFKKLILGNTLHEECIYQHARGKVSTNIWKLFQLQWHVTLKGLIRGTVYTNFSIHFSRFRCQCKRILLLILNGALCWRRSYWSGTLPIIHFVHTMHQGYICSLISLLYIHTYVHIWVVLWTLGRQNPWRWFDNKSKSWKLCWLSSMSRVEDLSETVQCTVHTYLYIYWLLFYKLYILQCYLQKIKYFKSKYKNFLFKKKSNIVFVPI